MWDRALRGHEWFDTRRFRKARYQAQRFRALGEGRFSAEGRLTLKGITRPVRFVFSWTERGQGARLRGRATLKRTDFRVGEGEWASDETVALVVDVEVDLRLRRGSD